MTKDFIELRNKVHKGEFRLDMTPKLWGYHYVNPQDINEENTLAITKDGETKAYCIYSTVTSGASKAYKILEICADTDEALSELIDQLTNNAVENQIDFVFLRESNEGYAKMLNAKSFVSFTDSVISIVLLNPRSLLLSLSEPTSRGKILALNISGSDPITVKVGTNGIMTVENQKPEVQISTDAETFLRLFFGKTSFQKEFLRRKVKASIMHLDVASRFFNLIKTSKWYMPSGDWC